MTKPRNWPMRDPFGGADVSEYGLYRYSLWRLWDWQLPILTAVLLNPSTADGNLDDPTIEKCLHYAHRDGFGALIVVNSEAWRATEPTYLFAERRLGTDTVGPRNDKAIHLALAVAGRVLLAWGNDVHPVRASKIQRWVNEAGHRPVCLGVNRNGTPKHPARLSKRLELVEMST